MSILVQALKYFKTILLADDERYTKPYKTYFGVDTIEKSWNNIIKFPKLWYTSYPSKHWRMSFQNKCYNVIPETIEDYEFCYSAN